MKKKPKRSKKYLIEVRVDMSYFMEVEVSASSILKAGEAAIYKARGDAMGLLPDAADLNSVDVTIEDGEEVEDNT